ncbi:hypothetical protein C8J56DRAFT_774719 [Mycena floridula]|nr:hypothetical protein C8J56DRAFT_774719 [Mycena floridula]
MATSGSEILPNPHTPLAFLPPTLANQFEVSRYIYAVTLGAYLWDILTNLGNEYQLLFKHRFRLPTAVYLASRIFTLISIVTAFIFQAAPVPNCGHLIIVYGIALALSESTTSFLFFLRVTAVWLPHKFVYGLFLVLWLCVFGTSIAFPIGIRGAHLGTTQQCIETAVRSAYLEASPIMIFINDTMIFLAITYRIISYLMSEETMTARINAFFRGKHISRLGRLLLQGGQHYYLISTCGSIVTAVMLVAPGLTAPYRGMLALPFASLKNAMGCIVFRHIKFGLITVDGITFSDFVAPNKPRNNISSFGNSVPMRYPHRDTDVGGETIDQAFHPNLMLQGDIPLSVRIDQKTISDVEYGQKGRVLGQDVRV